MDWTAFFTALLEAFKDCQEDDDTKLVSSIRNPDAGVKRGFERRIRMALGIGPFEWMREGRGIMRELEAERDAMTDADLLAFAKKAKGAAA